MQENSFVGGALMGGLAAIMSALGIAALGGVVFGFVLLGANCNVWSEQKAGEAELAKAEFSKQVRVQEAIATRDAATLLAEAEVERAKGVAAANKIIGDSLQGNESYLRYLWITLVGTVAQREVIYVPTEANLPILEASRLQEHPVPEHPDE